MPRKRLVGTREMNFVCTEHLCYFQCSEQKEMTRHRKTSHGHAHEHGAVAGLLSNTTRHQPVQARDVAFSHQTEEAPETGSQTVTGEDGYYLWSGSGPPFICGVGGCLKEYKNKGGHLTRHILTVHRLIAWYEGDTPPKEDLTTRESETPLALSGEEPELAAESGDRWSGRNPGGHQRKQQQ